MCQNAHKAPQNAEKRGDAQVKKLIVLLIALFLFAVLISVSPIVDYLIANAAEMPPESTSSEETARAESTEAEGGEETPAAVNETAVTGAVVLSTGTVLIAVGVFMRKRRPES